MRTLSVIFIIVVMGVACGLVSGAQAPPLVDVPMLFHGTSPAIEVMVNGQGPFVFLIDTGAQGRARADASLVERFKLSPAGQSAAVYSTTDKKVILNEFALDTISVGSLKFEKVIALSRDYNTVRYLSHIDGILAFELFQDHLLTLDFAGKRVRVEKGELPPADGAGILDFESRDGVPYIDLSVGPLKLKAMIDTGAIRAFDFPDTVVSRLPLASYPRAIGKGGSVIGEFEVREVRLQDTLSFGRYSFPEPVISFSDVDTEVLMGSTLLQDFTVTFDQKNHRVRFIRAGK